MKFANFIYQNAKWTCNKNSFDNLLSLPTTEEQLLTQLKGIDNKYFHERKFVQLLKTEFCLNQIALKKANSPYYKAILAHFDKYWQEFLRVKNIFSRNYLTFPANDQTRLELIATLIAKCTQFCMSEKQLANTLEKCEYLLDLTERETEYLPTVVALYKINYFCALAQTKLKNRDVLLAKFLNSPLRKGDFYTNDYYRQGVYRSNSLVSVCDCMGNSTVCYKGECPKISTKLFVYKANRNLFDTFCQSKFGIHTAQFQSENCNVKLCEQYFLQDNMEVRKTVLKNNGKNKGVFVVDVVCHYANGEVFSSDGALCVATKSCYTATAIVVNNEIFQGKVYQNRISFEVPLQPQETCAFDVVTIYSQDMPSIAQALENLCYFASTNCPYLTDKLQKVAKGQKLHLTTSSNALRTPPSLPTKKLNFTYQMGNDDVATFVNNDGHQTTLLGGFVFGTGGEKVYSVQCGRIKQLNKGKFVIDSKLSYDDGKSRCEILHNDNKVLTVSYSKAQRTLLYFPLEKTSKISLSDNTFTITDGKRQYFVACNGKIESYTTDGIECNSERLRYKLSNDIASGSCLAISFAKSEKVSVVIGSKKVTPVATPLLQESLVSTYLNYINGKAVFCLTNRLKRPNALYVAGVCYTNPQFAKEYLLDLWQNKHCYFYDGSGLLQKCKDELVFALGSIYYATLVKDQSFPTTEMKAQITSYLTKTTFDGLNVAVCALALKKASQIKGFDKVKCLVEYTNLKKRICNDSKLYAYAQAIGAVEMFNPSKERLKDLCNKYDVPKNWYYVSQLENLYGLKLNANSLVISPTVTAENVLEQFALNFDGKRIQTTFAKGTVRSMTLNGTQCHQPFDPYLLKNKENTLVVQY